MNKARVCLAVLAVLAFTAIEVGGASAAATTTAAKWYTGEGVGTELSGSTGINVAIESGTKFVMETKVGTGLTPVTFSATGVSCSSCTIENKEVTETAGKVAVGKEKLNFTGVTVSTPSTCALASETGVTGQFSTKELTVHTDFMNGTTWVQDYVPVTGSGTSAGVFKLVNGSGICPVAGTYSITGRLTSDAAPATSTGVTSLLRSISQAIQNSNGSGWFIGSQVFNVAGSTRTQAVVGYRIQTR